MECQPSGRFVAGEMRTSLSVPSALPSLFPAGGGGKLAAKTLVLYPLPTFARRRIRQQEGNGARRVRSGARGSPLQLRLYVSVHFVRKAQKCGRGRRVCRSCAELLSWLTSINCSFKKNKILFCDLEAVLQRGFQSFISTVRAT